MRQPKFNNLSIDRKGTETIRQRIAKSKKVKITINIDQDSLESLRKMAGQSGASYQKLLNQILREGLGGRTKNKKKIEKVEKEIARLKKLIA